jgi:hypothetical protein
VPSINSIRETLLNGLKTAANTSSVDENPLSISWMMSVSNEVSKAVASVAGSNHEHIPTLMPEIHIGSGASPQDVITCATVQIIVTGAALHHVVAGLAKQIIISYASKQLVMPFRALQGIVPVQPVDPIIRDSSEDPFACIRCDRWLCALRFKAGYLKPISARIALSRSLT